MLSRQTDRQTDCRRRSPRPDKKKTNQYLATFHIEIISSLFVSQRFRSAWPGPACEVDLVQCCELSWAELSWSTLWHLDHWRGEESSPAIGVVLVILVTATLPPCYVLLTSSPAHQHCTLLSPPSSVVNTKCPLECLSFSPLVCPSYAAPRATAGQGEDCITLVCSAELGWACNEDKFGSL